MAEHDVRFASGERVQVDEDETILSACLRAGVAQEYSCRVGMCLACCAEVLEGEVFQPGAHALTEAERERYALTCMARPRSDLVLDRGAYPPSIEDDAGAATAPADD